jgi:hypothetical protein
LEGIRGEKLGLVDRGGECMVNNNMFDEVVKISSGLARMLHPKFYQKSTF